MCVCVCVCVCVCLRAVMVSEKTNALYTVAAAAYDIASFPGHVGGEKAAWERGSSHTTETIHATHATHTLCLLQLVLE